MNSSSRSSQANSAYKLTLNPTRVVIQPNKIITSIAPTWHGKFLPKEPIFHYSLHDDTAARLPENLNSEVQVPKIIPIACPSNENIFMTHYSGQQAFSGPIEKLTVILIGNEEIPDVRTFASSVKTVEFRGHLSYTGPVFHVLRQLPLVKSVKFFIGQSQLPIFREVTDLEVNIPYSATPVCPNVESLEMHMDLQCYYEQPPACGRACENHCWDMIKMTFDTLTESLFGRCKEAFPNLRHFQADLPDSDLYNGGISGLMKSCRFLRERNLTELPTPNNNMNEPTNDNAASENQERPVCSHRSDFISYPRCGHSAFRRLQVQQADSKSVSTSCSSLSN